MMLNQINSKSSGRKVKRKHLKMEIKTLCIYFLHPNSSMGQKSTVAFVEKRRKSLDELSGICYNKVLDFALQEIMSWQI